MMGNCQVRFLGGRDAATYALLPDNKCLRYWMDTSKENKINRFALSKYSTELRNEFNFVKQLNSMAVQASAERAWAAIQRFFDNCKSNKPGKKGFPRFQHDNRSVEYKTSGWKLHPNKRRITFTDKKGIGELKLLGKWDIHTFGVKLIKRVRLVRRADGFYCQFSVDFDHSKPLKPTGNQVGLDVGLEYFYSDSNGNHVDNPRFFRKAEIDIKRVQRRIYKHKKGSLRRRKSRKVYARKHLRVSRQRNEFVKTEALTLVQSNDLVAYVRRSRSRRVDLKVKNMVRNHRFAKSINDVAWSQFRQWIEYFAQKHSRQAIAVKPHNTSQLCSNCGAKVKKELKVRIHKCSCGCVLQRDVNAAINILERARGGQPQSNAQEVAASTLLGEAARSWGSPP